MTTKKYYVYQHRKNDDGKIFYVGKGKDKRAYSLVRSDYWKRVVKKHGFSVEFVQVDLTEEEAFSVEIETIRLYRDQGIELINLTDGGEGTSGRITSEESRVNYRNSKTGVKNPMFEKTHSDKIKKQISEASKATHAKPEHKALLKEKLTGIARSNETKERIRESRLGKKHKESSKEKMRIAKIGKPSNRKGATLSDETKEKLRIANLGKQLSDKTKNKISAKGLGRSMSDDAKKKISEANKGRPSTRKGQTGFKTSDETKEKLRQLNLGKKLSEETRRKMSEAQKKAHLKGPRVVSEETKEKIRQKLLGRKRSN